MAGSAVTVRAAGAADAGDLAAVLGRAFFGDPPFAWMLPDERSRARRVAGVFRAELRAQAMRYGGVEVACDGATIIGGAIWLPPGHWAPTAGEQLRSLPGLVLTLGRGTGRGAALETTMARHHPGEKHWYLHAVGVDPPHQGQGVASALLRSRLARCDAESAPAYLESTKPGNVPIYQHFGFEVTGTVQPSGGCPPLTAMWRQPGP